MDKMVFKFKQGVKLTEAPPKIEEEKTLNQLEEAAIQAAAEEEQK